MGERAKGCSTPRRNLGESRRGMRRGSCEWVRERNRREEEGGEGGKEDSLSHQKGESGRQVSSDQRTRTECSGRGAPRRGDGRTKLLPRRGGREGDTQDGARSRHP